MVGGWLWVMIHWVMASEMRSSMAVLMGGVVCGFWGERFDEPIAVSGGLVNQQHE